MSVRPLLEGLWRGKETPDRAPVHCFKASGTVACHFAAYRQQRFGGVLVWRGSPAAANPHTAADNVELPITDSTNDPLCIGGCGMAR